MAEQIWEIGSEHGAVPLEELNNLARDSLMWFTPENAPPIQNGEKYWLLLDYADSRNWEIVSEYPEEPWDWMVILEIRISGIKNVSFNQNKR